MSFFGLWRTPAPVRERVPEARCATCGRALARYAVCTSCDAPGAQDWAAGNRAFCAWIHRERRD
ncbi:MAG TPA: hypothetical protein VEA38_00840 [Terriglobales bacterium]|nr:hypothetical protein [Terriglobales bacterium]